ncbi:NUDIX hydrolase [Evansella clarkii]|uniref:NUDIX hydrolase n=1 Tax=Evansella clarkii TaxID=79879 RepID=UPI000997CF21
MTQQGIVLAASVSIFKEDKVIIIKENKPGAEDKWNFPGGRIEFGEDILYTAQREVKEETGLDVNLTWTTGVYNFTSQTKNQVILFHFVGEVSGGFINLTEDNISESKWITVNELVKFENKELREPGVIKQILENLSKKNLHTINFYNEQF